MSTGVLHNQRIFFFLPSDALLCRWDVREGQPVVEGENTKIVLYELLSTCCCPYHAGTFIEVLTLSRIKFRFS
jgi:hypothetical protein